MKTPKAVFVPTREQRNQVCIMVLAGFSPAMMARDLGITQTNLKRHFKDELKNGTEQVAKRALVAIADEGFKNNSIPALKAIYAFAKTKSEPEPSPGRGSSRQAPVVEEATMRLGKKVQQKVEAQQAAKGKFATPPAPSGSNKLQ